MHALTKHSPQLDACLSSLHATRCACYRYGAHFDGGGAVNPACKLTTIVYANDDWQEADGGALLLFDERRRVWHSVMPRADTVVIFRADTVLHKVEPTHRAARYAMTAWWYVAGDGATKSRDGEIMVTDHYAGRKRPFCKDGTASATALRRAKANR